MITVEHLYHSYSRDDVYAVKDVSFDIPKGEVFGFLGPSGAGKSTTQGVLTGLLRLQKGHAEMAGTDVRNMKRQMFNQVGMSFEQSNVYSKMTARENLKFFARLFDVPTRDPDELLELVGLEGKGNMRAGEFSKGMKHRLTFARSMINSPQLWFLDEPTTGLDPAISSIIKGIIKQENQKGVTVFLTTHNMYIADELCDRVAFIVDGEIKLIDSPKNLKLQYGQSLVEVEYGEFGQLQSETLSTVDEGDKKRLQDLIARKHIRTMHTKEATLEEIFIIVTGRELA